MTTSSHCNKLSAKTIQNTKLQDFVKGFVWTVFLIEKNAAMLFFLQSSCHDVCQVRAPNKVATAFSA